MLVDLIRNVNNQILISSKTSGYARENDGYGIMSAQDVLSWVITSASQVVMGKENITINFKELVALKTAHWDYTSSTVGDTSIGDVKLCYSYDGNKYEEYDFFSYRINNLSGVDGDIQKMLYEYEGKIVQVKTFYTFVPTSDIQVGYDYVFYDGDGNIISINGTEVLSLFENLNGIYIMNKVYVLYDSNKKMVPISYEDLHSLRTFIEGERLINTGKVVLKYEYEYLDLMTNTAKYLFDKEVISIRLVFEGQTITPTVPFTLNLLDLYGEIVLKELPITIKDIPDNYTQPRYFSEFEFIPSIIKSFTEMLTHKA
jgi:hypothetical protein